MKKAIVRTNSGDQTATGPSRPCNKETSPTADRRLQNRKPLSSEQLYQTYDPATVSSPIGNLGKNCQPHSQRERALEWQRLRQSSRCESLYEDAAKIREEHERQAEQTRKSRISREETTITGYPKINDCVAVFSGLVLSADFRRVGTWRITLRSTRRTGRRRSSRRGKSWSWNIRRTTSSAPRPVS